ncbi:hypothetical protein ES703_119341 [subsurface metagenome]
MFFHAVFLVEEPPAGAVLQLAGDRTILKIAEHSGYQFIVGGIEIVKYGFGQLVIGIERVEELCK